MPSFGNIANIVTACWRNITCSASLPSPEHQQQEPLGQRLRQQQQEQRRLRRQQLQQRQRQRQHIDHNVASSSRFINCDSSDSNHSNDNGGNNAGGVNNGGNNDNGGGNNGGGNNVNNAGGGNNGGNNDNNAGDVNNGGNNDNGGGGNNGGSNDNSGGNNGGNNDNGGGGNNGGNNDNGGGGNNGGNSGNAGGGNNGGNNDDGGGGNNGGNNDDGGGGNSGGETSGGGGGDNNGENDQNDHFMWSIDLERHSCGEFSLAAAKVNIDMRSYSQVEVGSNAILVGLYDGHVGAHASWFLRRNFMTNLIATIKQQGNLTEEAIQEAITITDWGFLSLVKRCQRLEPSIVIHGSSCLVGVIWKGTLIIGQVGSARAVSGVMQESDNRIIAMPLTVSHNVNESWVIRQQLKEKHKIDPNIVLQGDDGVWRIKGIAELSRSVGDAYLKLSYIKVDSTFLDFQLPGGYLYEAVVSEEADLSSRAIKDTDRFFIFASSGFWEHITNERAIHIVCTNPRQGIAKRLLKAVQVEAARRANKSYSDFVAMPFMNRATIHDDMSVIVVFVDHNLVGVKDSDLEKRSFIGFRGSVGPSQFRKIDDLM